MIEHATLHSGDPLPERTFTPSNVSLFLYNAAIWNPHRIHYDEPYTREVENHPGVVIDGPLQGDWLAQTVVEWIDALATSGAPGEGVFGSLLEFEYSNRRACYLGEQLHISGRLAAIDHQQDQVTLELFVKNEEGKVTTRGRAVVRFASTEA